jgi:polar amino acid transport system substrate-binding protein
MIRRFVVMAAVAVVLSGAVAACGTSSSSGGGPHVAACGRAEIQRLLHTKGVLTIGTDTTVYTTWFVNHTPTNGKGYDSAVAYAVAAQQLRKVEVAWVRAVRRGIHAWAESFDFRLISLYKHSAPDSFVRTATTRCSRRSWPCGAARS